MPVCPRAVIGEIPAGGHVPEPDGPSEAPRGQGPAVGRERRQQSVIEGSAPSVGRGPRCPRPRAGYRRPQSGGRQDRPVGREGHGGDAVVGRRWRSRRVSRSHRIAAVGSWQAAARVPAVGREGDAEDPRWCLVRGLERRVFPTGVHVPRLDRVAGPRGQGLAVGREGERLNAAPAFPVRISFPPGAGEVPELDRPIQAPRRQRPPAVQERDGRTRCSSGPSASPRPRRSRPSTA